MPDNKTVTFDALIEFLKHTRSNHEKSIAARDPVIAAHIKDIGEWIDALAAAPTPAAQSAGQEAVAEVRDNPDDIGSIIETLGERPLPVGMKLYAAPVNASVPVGETALRSRWNRIANSEDMFEQFVSEVRALIAAPVSGGDHECKCDMRTKLVGDGCDVCNPERAGDLAERETDSFAALGAQVFGKRAADAQQVGANIRGEVAYQLHTRNRWLDMPTMRAIVDSAFDAAIAKNTLTSPAKVGGDGLIEQHARDSAELRRLCAARDEARRTAEYWKANHLAGNAEIERLKKLLEAKVGGDEREAFEAWAAKEWPGLVIDRAPLMGFYKGDDGARLEDMWAAWQARAALSADGGEDKRDAERLDWLMQHVCADEIEGIRSLPYGIDMDEYLHLFREAIDDAIAANQARKGE